MKLTAEQLASYHRDGYLFFPDLFSLEEIDVLRGDLPGIFSQERPEVIRERATGAPRTAFGVHRYSDAFARLARHPRLIEPAMQILESQVYLHQFKINAKAAFDGEIWQWHQDFPTWFNDDGMLIPRAMNLAVFLDDVNEFNGPLMFIPGSHVEGPVRSFHDKVTTSYPLWSIDHAKIAELANARGIVSPKGKAGSAMVFYSTMVHASGPNLSPWSRNTVYVSANAVDNAITKPTRPDYIAERDFTPISPLADDCLSRSATAGASR